MATHVDIVAQFDDRSVMVSANELKRNLERTGDDAGDAFAKGFEKSAPRIQKAYENAYSGAEKAASKLRAEEARLSEVRIRAQKEAEQVAAAEAKVEHYRTNLPSLTATIASAERELADIREKHNSTLSQLTVRTESFTRAVTNQRTAVADLGRVFQEVESGASGLSSSASGLGGSFGGVMAGGIAVAGQALGDLVGVAASASQALIALPAVVGAAGAAFGTLQLATLGFDNALKAIGDPKKFSEALKQLSPDAQQAALAINALMPEFKQLKNATQDALFANIGPQLTQLTNQLLPTIQTMTTGIASAMNQAMSGVAQQLMTPQTMSSIQTFSQNVVQAFKVIEPAVAPLTKALGELMAVGSGALPQIAAAASTAATAFSAFIDKASKSGDMQRALDAGLNTLEQLAPVALHFGEAFISLAPVGEQVLPSVVKALDDTAAVLPDIIRLAADSGNIFKTWSDLLTVIDPIVKVIDLGMKAINSDIPGINASLGDMISPLHLIADLVNSIKWFFDPGSRDNALHQAQDAAEKGSQARQAYGPGYGGPGQPLSPTFGNPGDPGALNPLFPAGQGNPPLNGDVADRYARADRAAHPNGGASAGLPPGMFRRRDGSIGYASPPSLSTGALPGPLGAGSGPKLPTAPVLPFDSALPQGISGLPQTAELYSAESSFLDARHAAAEKQARLNQLEKDNSAKASDIQNARNEAIQAARTQNEAELRMYDTATKKLSAQATQMQQLGAKLDNDFGVSKGLAGIADNLTRFLANLALAPALGALQAVKTSEGFDSTKSGSGLMGMLGSSGALGPRFMPNAAGAPTGGYVMGPQGPQFMPGVAGNSTGATPSAMGPSGLQPGGQPGMGGPAGVQPSAAMAPLAGPGGSGTSPNGFKLFAPEQNFSVNGVSTQGAAGGPAQRLQEFAQWFNDNIEPVKQFAGYDAGGHGMGTKSNHTSGTALDINWDDFTALQGHGADARTHFSPAQMQAISQELAQTGMTWGQYWTPDSRDPGHFELGGASYDKGAQNIGPAAGQPPSSGGGGPGGGPGWFPSRPGGPAGIVGPNFNEHPQPDPAYSPNHPTGRGNFNPGVKLDTSTTSVAPPYDPNRLLFGDIVAPYTDTPAYKGDATWPESHQNGSQPNGISPFVGGSPPLSPGVPGVPGPGSTPGAPGWLGNHGAAPSKSVAGGRSWGEGTPASQGISFNGGIIGAAVSAAAGAAGAAGSFGAGGGAASAAADIGMQLIGRAVGAGGQYVGNAVGGLMETFSLNDSALGDPSKSWFGKLAIAGAGARPALPNSAGALGGEQNKNMAEGGKKPAEPLTPEQAAAQKAAGGGAGDSAGKGGDTINNNVTMNNPQVRDVNGGMRDAQAHLSATQGAKQPR